MGEWKNNLIDGFGIYSNERGKTFIKAQKKIINTDMEIVYILIVKNISDFIKMLKKWIWYL